ncbi:FxLYD domain-containing protein [Emergencia timonensis]|uniref:FxLYD domain-containing protein n=1 Tax=Emergencia timonensis TaxID=1776384 RepID=UPI001D062FBC|nr:FxLYD domain-containing protein [Emergencia timonensis]MCB6475554.1 FxLYD domain-containing protein [Emergencia timonensis]
MKQKSMTKACSVCGAEIAKNAKTCPQCGAKNKKPFYKKAWFIIIVVLIVLGVIGSALGGGSDDEQKSQEPKTSTTENKDSKNENQDDKYMYNDFKLMNKGEFNAESDGYSITISGKVKNMTGKELSYAQIEFTIYDADGAQVGTALANINNLEKDGVWKFKAISLDSVEGNYKYKLADITYW